MHACMLAHSCANTHDCDLASSLFCDSRVSLMPISHALSTNSIVVSSSLHICAHIDYHSFKSICAHMHNHSLTYMHTSHRSLTYMHTWARSYLHVKRNSLGMCGLSVLHSHKPVCSKGAIMPARMCAHTGTSRSACMYAHRRDHNCTYIHAIMPTPKCTCGCHHACTYVRT